MLNTNIAKSKEEIGFSILFLGLCIQLYGFYLIQFSIETYISIIFICTISIVSFLYISKIKNRLISIILFILLFITLICSIEAMILHFEIYSKITSDEMLLLQNNIQR